MKHLTKEAQDAYKHAFYAGVKAAKDAIQKNMVDDWEYWGQASTDERCWTVDEIEVELPE